MASVQTEKIYKCPNIQNILKLIILYYNNIITRFCMHFVQFMANDTLSSLHMSVLTDSKFVFIIIILIIIVIAMAYGDVFRENSGINALSVLEG